MRVDRGRLDPGLGLVRALAPPGELEDGGVVDEAIDGSRRGHRVLEDAIPLSKDEVGDFQNLPMKPRVCRVTGQASAWRASL